MPTCTLYFEAYITKILPAISESTSLMCTFTLYFEPNIHFPIKYTVPALSVATACRHQWCTLKSAH